MWRPLAGLLAAAVATAAMAADRPNILLVVSEDNGPELGCYGTPFVRTPRLDRLAAEGVRFDRAFVTQAGCSPSRASFLTGLYPHQHGQVGLATWGFRMFREDTPNLARSLKAAGYRTGLVGKLHVNPESAFPFDFSRIPTGNFERKDLAGYARHAAEFFAAGEAPFFLSVNYPDAHGPWLRQVDGLPAEPLDAGDVTPLPYFGVDTPQLREATANYANCLMRLDSLVGDLLDALERSGKARDTLVVYIGDHGCDMLRGKRTCYEGGLRIPMLVRWPGHARGGQVRSELVSTIDLAPTFLAVSGAEPIPGLAGRSLVPLLEGGRPEWRTELFAEYHTHAAATNCYPQRSVRDERYKLIENLLPGQVNPGVAYTFKEFDTAPAAIAAGPAEVREAYAVMERPPRYELYDLEADPYEFVNLADDPAHAAVRDRLAAAVTAWRRETADPLLDPAVTRRFNAEVTAVRSKRNARDIRWGYTDYFLGREPAADPDAAVRPNVLMIVADDLNDWIGCLGGHPDVKTPNLDRLARRGLLFTNAHCPAPVCNPSRAAVLTGRAPHATGIYDNATIWHRKLPGVASLPGHFKAHGYRVFGGGKVYHHMPDFNRPDDWDEYFEQVFDGHAQQALRRGVAAKDFRWPEGFPLNGLPEVAALGNPPETPREFDWGPFDASDMEMGDGRMVAWAEKILRAPPSEPFFLAAGIYRPHLPWYAPRGYFEMYPPAGITPPPIKAGDVDDLPSIGQAMAAGRRGDLEIVRRHGKERELLQAYLANVSYCDALVGRLLDAVDAGPARDRTIVVLWSDHGWHFGEKDHLHKFTLWERSTRVPFMIAAPGVTTAETATGRPVGLIDLFPTLVELCGLPTPPGLDGRSLVPLLEDPAAGWDSPAITTHGAGNHALRGERWRYIRYSDGGEELYDHDADPHEWTNLAGRPEHAAVIAGLRTALPAERPTEAVGPPAADGDDARAARKRKRKAARQETAP